MGSFAKKTCFSYQAFLSSPAALTSSCLKQHGQILKRNWKTKNRIKLEPLCYRASKHIQNVNAINKTKCHMCLGQKHLRVFTADRTRGFIISFIYDKAVLLPHPLASMEILPRRGLHDQPQLVGITNSTD